MASEKSTRSSSSRKDSEAGTTGDELGTIISRHNRLIRTMWQLSVAMTSMTVVYLVIIGFTQRDTYESFYSEAYKSCRLEEKLHLGSRGSLLLSYINESSEARFILQSSDSGKTFVEVGEMPYTDSISILSATPDGKAFIVADLQGNLFVKSTGAPGFRKLETKPAPRGSYTKISYKPGTTLAYLYGARFVSELDYESDNLQHYQSPGLYEIKELNFSENGMVNAVIKDKTTGDLFPVLSPGVAKLFSTFDRELKSAAARNDEQADSIPKTAQKKK